MFNLGRLDDLSRGLGVKLPFLQEVLDDFDTAPQSLFKELTLWPADQNKKPRDVVSIRRPWRLLQERIYLKLLLPRFRPSKVSHGGVRGRSPATNARVHLGNTHAFVADISNFFPSISCGRVNRLFLSEACSYNVARALTRLCTHNYHLALGLITSPIIANELLRPVDKHIQRACRRRGLSYSRFIDDITISGRYEIERSGIGEAVQQILERHRFKLAKNKTAIGRLDVPPNRERVGNDAEQLSITGVVLKGDHIDPSRRFVRELDRIIEDHLSLADDGVFAGPLLMEDEVFGRAHHACALNPGRRRMVLGKLKKIEWSKVMRHAADRELVRFRKRFTARGMPRPDCSEPLPLAAGAKFVREYYQAHTHDPSEAPFDVPNN